jgi:branched-chain amino acid aminotransferase
VIHQQILHNDRICDSREAVLRPGQLGLLSGWGVFSTIRVVDGVLFAFDRHWARMKRDALLMRVPFPTDPQAFENSLLKLVEANQAWNATLRVVVIRNQGGLWEGPGERSFDVAAMTANIKTWPATVRLGVVPQARHAENTFAGTKVLSWAQNLTWLEEAQAQGFDEVVLLNERDEVAEGTSANIFAVYENAVCTPPLASGCLPGVTRNLLLEEKFVAGIDVVERTMRLEDLERANQVFITSTTRGLLPVAFIDSLSIRNEGDVCARLQDAFEKYVQEYAAARSGARSGSRG